MKKFFLAAIVLVGLSIALSAQSITVTKPASNDT